MINWVPNKPINNELVQNLLQKCQEMKQYTNNGPNIKLLEEFIIEGPVVLAESTFENCPRLVRRIYLQTRFVDCIYGKYCELQCSLKFEKVECGISLEEFEDDSNIVILRCGHAFLEDSLQEWTKRQRICPACKQRI